MAVVTVNTELIRTDLKKMGVTQEQVGISIGRSRTWLGNILHDGRATEESVAKIEQALFKPSGRYVIEEEKPEEKPEKSTASGPAEYVRIVKLLEELLKTESVIRAQNEELLGAIHSWRKTCVDQNAKIIEKATEQITQTLKVRSAIERAIERSAKNETL